MIFVGGSYSFQLLQMAHVKNAGGGPSDEDPRPLPRQPVDAKGKATKKLATKKRKYPDADTTRAVAVTEAAERAEREEMLGVVLLLHISFHQLRGPQSRRLSVVMVV